MVNHMKTILMPTHPADRVASKPLRESPALMVAKRPQFRLAMHCVHFVAQDRASKIP